jgi:hypothetical protein
MSVLDQNLLSVWADMKEDYAIWNMNQLFENKAELATTWENIYEWRETTAIWNELPRKNDIGSAEFQYYGHFIGCVLAPACIEALKFEHQKPIQQGRAALRKEYEQLSNILKKMYRNETQTYLADEMCPPLWEGIWNGEKLEYSKSPISFGELIQKISKLASIYALEEASRPRFSEKVGEKHITFAKCMALSMIEFFGKPNSEATACFCNAYCETDISREDVDGYLSSLDIDNALENLDLLYEPFNEANLKLRPTKHNLTK